MSGGWSTRITSSSQPLTDSSVESLAEGLLGFRLGDGHDLVADGQHRLRLRDHDVPLPNDGHDGGFERKAKLVHGAACSRGVLSQRQLHERRESAGDAEGHATDLLDEPLLGGYIIEVTFIEVTFVWWFALLLGDFIFYVLLTPIWIGLRGLAWIAEFRRRRRS